MVCIMYCSKFRVAGCGVYNLQRFAHISWGAHVFARIVHNLSQRHALIKDIFKLINIYMLSTNVKGISHTCTRRCRRRGILLRVAISRIVDELREYCMDTYKQKQVKQYLPSKAPPYRLHRSDPYNKYPAPPSHKDGPKFCIKAQVASLTLSTASRGGRIYTPERQAKLGKSLTFKTKPQLIGNPV